MKLNLRNKISNTSHKNRKTRPSQFSKMLKNNTKDTSIDSSTITIQKRNYLKLKLKKQKEISQLKLDNLEKNGAEVKD